MVRLSIEDYDKLIKEIIYENDTLVLTVEKYERNDLIIQYFEKLDDKSYFIEPNDDNWVLKQKNESSVSTIIKEFEELNKAYQYLCKLNKQN